MTACDLACEVEDAPARECCERQRTNLAALDAHLASPEHQQSCCPCTFTD